MSVGGIGHQDIDLANGHVVDQTRRRSTFEVHRRPPNDATTMALNQKKKNSKNRVEQCLPPITQSQNSAPLTQTLTSEMSGPYETIVDGTYEVPVNRERQDLWIEADEEEEQEGMGPGGPIDHDRASALETAIDKSALRAQRFHTRNKVC